MYSAVKLGPDRVQRGDGVRKRACAVRHACKPAQLNAESDPDLGIVGVYGILTAPPLIALTRSRMRHVGVDTGGPVLCRQMCTLIALQDLRLGASRFGDAGAEALAAHMPALAQLRALYISGCGPTVAGTVAHAL